MQSCREGKPILLSHSAGRGRLGGSKVAATPSSQNPLRRRFHLRLWQGIVLGGRCRGAVVLSGWGMKLGALRPSGGIGNFGGSDTFRFEVRLAPVV
jgi:hypothetical protein